LYLTIYLFLIYYFLKASAIRMLILKFICYFLSLLLFIVFNGIGDLHGSEILYVTFYLDAKSNQKGQDWIFLLKNSNFFFRKIASLFFMFLKESAIRKRVPNSREIMF